MSHSTPTSAPGLAHICAGTGCRYALSHWLENGNLYGETIVILDPDMILLRHAPAAMASRAA